MGAGHDFIEEAHDVPRTSVTRFADDVLTSLTVVVSHDFGTETGRAFAVIGSEYGGSRATRLPQDRLDALTEWIESLDTDGEG